MQEFPGPIEIRFVSGFDRGAGYPVPPRFLRVAGLVHRFAIIQETFVQGATDMVFDEGLWKAVIDYTAQFRKGGLLTTAASVEDIGRRESSLEHYLDGWEKTDPQDREPAQLLLVRKGRILELCAMPELWCQVGGPKAYHDSYTYVLYSRRDLSGEIPDFLRARPQASDWVLMPVQPPANEPSLWRRLFGRS